MGSIWDQLVNYRKMKTLPDGSRLLLRPLQKQDRQALIDLFTRASTEDLKWFRSDVSRPEVVDSWVDNLDYRRVFPLVAYLGDELIGDATLHFGRHHHIHHAFLRIFLDSAYRRRGIGTIMLQTLIDVSRQVGLKRLYAEVVASQIQVIKAFKDLGFYQEAILEDYFITEDGEMMDVAILVLPLVKTSGKF
jgi:RimJ/RimL family protein N-acetyltransferase